MASLTEKYSLGRNKIEGLIKKSGRKREIQVISRAQGLKQTTMKEAKEKGLAFFFEERVSSEVILTCGSQIRINAQFAKE